jgi:hypothetical protein
MQWSRNLVQDSNFPDHTISKFPDVFRTELHFDEKPKKNGYRTARSKENLEKSLLFHLLGPVQLADASENPFLYEGGVQHGGNLETMRPGRSESGTQFCNNRNSFTVFSWNTSG